MGVLSLVLAGCGALSAPTLPEMPTPVATAVPFSLNASRELIVDPVSDVVPAVDPGIMGLVNAVSQQQLMGYVQTMQGFGNRNAFSTTEDERFGIGATRRWIFSEFERVGNGRLQVRFDDFPLTYGEFSATQQNVIATLPGVSSSPEVIVITAHYDNRATEIADGETFAPGANDNGSGVALLIETARLLSSQEWNHTIIFAAVSAEEQGTYGSRFLVQKLFLDGATVMAALNYDAVGGRDGIPQNVRLFASELHSSPSGQLGRYYEYIGGLYLPRFPVHLIDALDREGRWGDHREFVKIGVAAIRVIESVEDPDMVNSKSDTWDRVDYHYLQQVVQLNVAVVANMAGSLVHPQPPIIETADSGSFHLQWFVDEDAAGYAFAFRPVEQPDLPVFRLVRAAQAGNVMFTGLDAGQIYTVSMAAMDENGRLSYFSPEVLIDPGLISSSN
ncbi:MAG: M20/M25/M40 family metallo-hydrolase [Anaerolineales bacterium]|nr:M20/M25/M40 family metallo-hydrolase [Anaerolineales bacterium]